VSWWLHVATTNRAEKTWVMLQHEMESCARLPARRSNCSALRSTAETGQGGSIVVTRGVRDLRGLDVAALNVVLADYDAIDADNDPYGERDVSDLPLFSADQLWKIDCYDAELAFSSDDPTDGSATNRVPALLTRRMRRRGNQVPRDLLVRKGKVARSSLQRFILRHRERE
jgi:hypothetical protein